MRKALVFYPIAGGKLRAGMVHVALAAGRTRQTLRPHRLIDTGARPSLLHTSTPQHPAPGTPNAGRATTTEQMDVNRRRATQCNREPLAAQSGSSGSSQSLHHGCAGRGVVCHEPRDREHTRENEPREPAASEDRQHLLRPLSLIVAPSRPSVSARLGAR